MQCLWQRSTAAEPFHSSIDTAWHFHVPRCVVASYVQRCSPMSDACLPTNRARESPELQDRPARRRTALFNARRYASAVHAVVMCPSVCPSVGQKPELYPKRLEESSCHGGFLPPLPRCVIRKFGYLQKVTNISQSFTYKMTAKINWHRYGTKLLHCHPMYCRRA